MPSRTSSTDPRGTVVKTKFAKTYVKEEKRFQNKINNADFADVIDEARPVRRTGLGNRLMTLRRRHHFRGTETQRHTEGTYRAAQLPFSTAGIAPAGPGIGKMVPKTRKYSERQGLDGCFGDDKISVLDPSLFQKCEYLDPFVRNSGECFKMSESGTLKFSPKFVTPYKFADYKDSTLLKTMFPSSSPPRVVPTTFLQIVPTADTRVDDLYEASKTPSAMASGRC